MARSPARSVQSLRQHRDTDPQSNLRSEYRLLTAGAGGSVLPEAFCGSRSDAEACEVEHWRPSIAKVDPEGEQGWFFQSQRRRCLVSVLLRVGTRTTRCWPTDCHVCSLHLDKRGPGCKLELWGPSSSITNPKGEHGGCFGSPRPSCLVWVWWRVGVRYTPYRPLEDHK